MVELYKFTRDGICAVISDDVASALGRAPITFAKYAEDHAEYFK